MEELIVRIQALAKRRSGQVNKLSVDDLVLDVQGRSATRGGRDIKLSPTGLKLLECLMRNSPSPVSRELLMQHVWGEEPPDSNSLKVHIHHLRKQLDFADLPSLLHTVAGFGFVVKRDDKS